MTNGPPSPRRCPTRELNLYVELQRYRDWLVTQALVRTQGNRAGAARLLGIKRTTVAMMIRPKQTTGDGRHEGHADRLLELRELSQTREGDANEGAED